jgi:hypothetical protein
LRPVATSNRQSGRPTKARVVHEIRHDVDAGVRTARVLGQRLGEATRSASNVDQVVLGLEAMLDEDRSLDNAERLELAADCQTHGFVSPVPAAQAIDKFTVSGSDVQFVHVS